HLNACGNWSVFYWRFSYPESTPCAVMLLKTKPWPNFPNWTSRARPNKDQQASVGVRDPIESRAVEERWFVLYCPWIWLQKVGEFKISAPPGFGCSGLFRYFMDMVNCK